MPNLFDPLTIRGLTLRNRIVMSPMCQYSAGPDGLPTDWHLVHYGARASGGVGLVMLEATAVESRGRLSTGDLGLYDDSQIEPLARIVRFCQEQGARVGVQLAHGGRKAFSNLKGHGPEPIVGPEVVPFDEGWRTPAALAVDEIDQIVAAFGRAARRAREAGFDLVEVHGAHGYLVNQFLSPLTNHRADDYGGSLANRARLAYRVIDAVRAEWTDESPLFVRLSCSDWAPGGIDLAEIVELARAFSQRGVDVIDCSSGGTVNVVPPAKPGYQVPFAEEVRREAEVPTVAVGLITEPEQADEIVASGKADLVALGRSLLREPHWPLFAAKALGVSLPWPKQYERARV